MVRVRRRKKKIREMTPEELASAPDETIIAWNFIRIRKSLGLTQEEAAELGKTITSYVGKVEIGAVSFGTRAQQKWSKIFKVARTEFLKHPEPGVAVIGTVVDRGVLTDYPPGQQLEYMPPLSGYTDEKAGREGLYCLRVDTDNLYPHLRRDSYLYIITTPLSAIRNDNFVIYAERQEWGSIKEVEWLDDGKVLLKGLGKGSTVTKEATELTTMQKVILISI
jgi:transcriptional regulator with XRE-family HTH domain